MPRLMWLRRRHLQYRKALQRFREPLGVRPKWVNVVMNRDVVAFIGGLPPESKSCIEISGASRKELGWQAYRTTSFPEFDLCAPPADMPTYDVVICEQVLEHVVDPLTAVRTLRDLTTPGGRLIISTPFLLRVHGHPRDYWRFTEGGLVKLLQSADIRVDSSHTWGNRRAVRGNLWRWKIYRPWHTLRNNPEVPISVWAFCTRPDER